MVRVRVCGVGVRSNQLQRNFTEQEEVKVKVDSTEPAKSDERQLLA